MPRLVCFSSCVLVNMASAVDYGTQHYLFMAGNDRASPDCPSVSWPTVHTNVICESSGGVLIAVHVLTLHTIYLCNNTSVNYN